MMSRSKLFSFSGIGILIIGIVLWVGIPLVGGERTRPSVDSEFPAAAASIFSARPVSGLVPIDQNISTINSKDPVFIAENQSPKDSDIRIRLRFTNSSCEQPGRLRIFLEGKTISERKFPSGPSFSNIEVDIPLAAHSSVLLPMALESVPCAPVNAGGVNFGTLEVLSVLPAS